VNLSLGFVTQRQFFLKLCNAFCLPRNQLFVCHRFHFSLLFRVDRSIPKKPSNPSFQANFATLVA
jgi:hypothetical protein